MDLVKKRNFSENITLTADKSLIDLIIETIQEIVLIVDVNFGTIQSANSYALNEFGNIVGSNYIESFKISFNSIISEDYKSICEPQLENEFHLIRERKKYLVKENILDSSPDKKLLVKFQKESDFIVAETIFKDDCSLFLNAVGLPILIKDSENQVVFCNDEFSKEFLRDGKNEVLGKSFLSLSKVIPKAIIDSYFQYEIELLNLGGKRNYQIKLNNAQETVMYLVSASCINLPNSDKEAIVTIYNSIGTEQTSKNGDDLNTSSELFGREKPEFISGLSHELRTPLNAIMGFTEILLIKEENQSLKNYLDIIKESGLKILELIDNIVDYTLLESGSISIIYKEFSIIDAFLSVVDAFKAKIASKDINLIINIADNLPKMIVLDENRFKQILMNVLSNAVKFTNSGFIKIELSSKYSSSSKELIDLDIRIEDSGIGIKEELLNGVYNVFNIHSGTNIKKYQGTGLGLAITKQLVDKLNGNINITGKVNIGTLVEINFPNVAFEDIVDEPISPAIEDINDKKVKNSIVLVADDVEYNRDLIAEFLSNMNISILEAEGGEETLEIIKQIKPDVILLDLIMPDIDGIQTATKIKDTPNLADIPLIAFTAANNSETLSPDNNELFNGYLQKPVNKTALIEELKKYLPITSFLKDLPLSSLKPEIDFNKPYTGDISIVLPLIIRMLENELKTKWQKAVNNPNIGKIEFLVQDLQLIYKKYNIEFINKYCKSLKSCIETENEQKLNCLLSEFPDLIERVKSIK